MAKTRLVSARSELRKGFAMPSKQKIFSALRKRSKTFIMNLFWFAFGKLSRTDKIKSLMRIEGLRRAGRRKTRRKTRTRRRKSRTRRKAGRRKSKTRRRTKTRRSGKRRTAKQRAATRKLVAFNRRRRR